MIHNRQRHSTVKRRTVRAGGETRIFSRGRWLRLQSTLSQSLDELALEQEENDDHRRDHDH